MTEIDVQHSLSPDGDGWVCAVHLTGTGGDPRSYRVRVRRSDLTRYAPGDDEPADLVRRSFAFLLEREPPSAILPNFDLPVIARYFPEYEREIAAGSPGR
jgi:hypothetical protein